MTRPNKFLLLLGPSGVGKSTLMNQLRRLDDRFSYQSPFTTRPLREGETDKISITEEAMDELNSRGKLLTINSLFGIRYATPLDPIHEAFDTGKFPMLDWPASRIDIMINAFSLQQLYIVYVFPPSLTELKKRLMSDNRDVDGKRYSAGCEDLRRYTNGEYDQFVHLRMCPTLENVDQVVRAIYEGYLDSCHERSSANCAAECS